MEKKKRTGFNIHSRMNRMNRSNLFLESKTDFLDKYDNEPKFKYIDSPYMGLAKLAVVELNGKFNIIDIDGKELSELWFDRIYEFYGGFAVVVLKNKVNFIDSTGYLISNVWFDAVDPLFLYSKTEVVLNGKSYIMNVAGDIEVKPGVWKYPKSEDELNESYSYRNRVSLKDYILENLRK